MNTDQTIQHANSLAPLFKAIAEPPSADQLRSILAGEYTRLKLLESQCSPRALSVQTPQRDGYYLAFHRVRNRWEAAYWNLRLGWFEIGSDAQDFTHWMPQPPKP